MMFPNNNKAVLQKLTTRSLQANRTRNSFVILAILLTTWLITSFFSVGLSFVKSFEMQELKMIGTQAQAYLTSPTEEQLEKLQKLEYIKDVGLQTRIGNLVNNTPEMADLSIAMLWYDSVEWNSMRKPVIEGLKGEYPQTSNEIAVPLWILQHMGIDKPQLGMDLSLTYSITKKGVKAEKKDTFVLSGWFTEYSHLRSGNSGELLVSTAFAESQGAVSKHPGNASIVFKGKDSIDELIVTLEQDILPTNGQRLESVSMGSTSSSEQTAATMIGYAGIILFVMLSGYLLIYNVLYISVSRDTRFYGLLKTLGTTQRQIKKMVRGQASRLALIGIPLGLAAGALTSLGMVPLAMNTMDLDSSVEISFHPLIFIGAGLFAWITTMISSIKPARIAGKVSPVEAVRYTGTMVKSKTKRGTGGSKLHRLALRNIFRVKKRAIVVFLSLFLGMTTFLMVNTLVLSMNTDHFIAEYMDNDFTLNNQTMAFGFQGEKKPKITEDMIAAIRKMEGVRMLFKSYKAFVHMQYDPTVFGTYVDEFATAYNIDRLSDEQLSQSEGMFSSVHIIGLDPEQVKLLEDKLGITVDMERFQTGELALLDNSSFGGIKAGNSFQISMLDTDTVANFEIGATADLSSLESSHFLAPNVYISLAAMEKLYKDPLIEKLNINADKAKWQQISDQLEGLIGGDNELMLESKVSMTAFMKSAKLTFYIMGGGIALILAFIGILNFVNIMFTGVVARKLEFAVMESIGMTSRQLKKLLLFEGAGYAVISTLLISSIGTLLSYGAYYMFSQEATYAVFSFPTVPLAMAIIIVFAVCLTVPLIAYRQIKKHSIVERLRQME